MTKTIIQEANNIVRLQHVEETNKSLKYLNDELKSNGNWNQGFDLNTYRCSAKSKKDCNVKEEYVLRPIDDPYLPEWKSGPIEFVLWLFQQLLVIVGSFIGLYLYYFTKKDT